MKDVAGENVRTMVSYLKGALILLQNCDGFPTDTIVLLKNIMCSAECNELSEFMKIVYINHKQKTDVIEPTTYLDLTELEYRALYKGQKWTKLEINPASRFYVNDAGAVGTSVDNHTRVSDDSRTGRGRGGQGGHDGCVGRGHGRNVDYHDYGKQGHIDHN